MNTATALAPLSGRHTLTEAQASATVAAGATLVMGERRPPRGLVHGPGDPDRVTRDNPRFRLEFFAPVAMLFRAVDEKQTVPLANDFPRARRHGGDHGRTARAAGG